jgi:IS30 family transposase
MGRQRKHDYDRIAALAAEGWSERQIAAMVGAHRNTIHKILKPDYRLRTYAAARMKYAARKQGGDHATS